MKSGRRRVTYRIKPITHMLVKPLSAKLKRSQSNVKLIANHALAER